MTKNLLQVVKVEASLIEEIKHSFDKLPETDHADGKYRLRKYCKVRAESSKGRRFFIEKLDERTFKQSRKYNKHQGGMTRVFEEIDDEVVHSQAIKELVSYYYNFCSFEGLREFDIHQMRVKCRGGATLLSPEGWHQDGYDCVAMIGINRENVFGGEVLLSTSKTESPFLSAVIETGTMVIIDDSHLWHNGRSIQPVDDDKPAYMDIIVFTGRK